MNIRRRIPIAILLPACAGILIVFVPSARAARPAPLPAAPTNDDCMACHGDPSAVRADGRPVAVAAARFGASVHGQASLACVDCHQDLETTVEFPHAEKLVKVNCASCHLEEGTQCDRGVHAEARRKSVQSVAATCADCHGSHEIKSSKDPDSLTYHLTLPATCGRCHGSAETIKRGNIAIGNVYTLYQDSIHGRALIRSGLLVAPNCSDCHGNHDVRRRTDAASKVFKTNLPVTCGRCHEGVKQHYDTGIHGQALRKGDARAPVCADCHTAHRIRRVDVEAWKLDVIRECGTCHEESIKTYRDTFHGQVTNLGFTRVAACADCHGSHEIFPKADPHSTVSAARVVGTCQKCHARANANFARYDPHADPHNLVRNPTLFYAARFMKILLIGVFAFFGLHTSLWLPRAIFDRRQKGRERAGAEPPVAERHNGNGDDAA